MPGLAQGRVFAGRAALERGLVDALGGMEEALGKLKELAGIDAARDVELVEYPERKGALALIGELFEREGRTPQSVLRVLSLARRLAAPPGASIVRLPADVRFGP
jgi:ClpP class serine protease